jgi:GntR family transcriptional regulator
MVMRFTVNPASSAPIYAQLVEQVKHAVAAGTLQVNDPLPSLRDVSTRLRISPLTVKKAYGELEALGLATTEHGRGTFISGGSAVFSEGYRHGVLVQAVDQLLIEAVNLNVPLEEVIALLRERRAQLEHGQVVEPQHGKART